MKKVPITIGLSEREIAKTFQQSERLVTRTIGLSERKLEQVFETQFEDSGVPSNALLYTDTSPVLYTDTSNVVYS